MVIFLKIIFNKILSTLKMSFGFIFAKQWNSLARPPTGLHPINRVSGAGWSRHTCISKGFHVSSRSLHFYISFLGWKLFSFVFCHSLSLLYHKITQRNKSMSAVQISECSMSLLRHIGTYYASLYPRCFRTTWCQCCQMVPN